MQRISIPNEQPCLQPVHFYQGDMTSFIRFVGGSCTVSHRDVDKILASIAPYVDPNILVEVKGFPRYCTAESTDRNTRAFMQYGNHSACDATIEQTKMLSSKTENAATPSLWMNTCVGISYIFSNVPW